MGTAAFMVFVAVTVGAIGAATANFVGWRLGTPSPTHEEAEAAVGVGLPGVPVELGWHDDVRDVHYVRQPRAEHLPGQQQANVQDEAASREAFDKARERLTAAGWQTESGSSTRADGAFFVASRGAMVMEWEFFPRGSYDSPPGDSIEVWVWRFTPPQIKALTVVGWLLGAALGWWLARSVLRLTDKRTRSGLIVATSSVAVVLMISTLVAIYFTAHNLLDIPMRNGQPVAIWISYAPFLIPFGFHLG